MGVKIFINNSEVLDLQNSSFAIFYEDLLNEIDEKKLEIPPNVNFLLDELYTGCFGVGLDLADFLKTTEDALFFAMLVNKTIYRIQISANPYHSNIEIILLNFATAIQKYAKGISNDIDRKD